MTRLWSMLNVIQRSRLWCIGICLLSFCACATTTDQATVTVMDTPGRLAIEVSAQQLSMPQGTIVALRVESERTSDPLVGRPNRSGVPDDELYLVSSDPSVVQVLRQRGNTFAAIGRAEGVATLTGGPGQTGPQATLQVTVRPAR